MNAKEGFKRTQSRKALMEYPTPLEIDTDRPWGGFVVLPPEAKRPKILWLQQEASLQLHHEKDELFMIIEGEIAALRGKLLKTVEDTIQNLEETIAKPGDILWIVRGTVHAFVPLGPCVTMMDAAMGENPREDDIVRIYDRNGRNMPITGIEPLPQGKYPPGTSVRVIWQALQ